jgi:RNA polymerase sigma factor (sigma-70 family)
MSIVKLFKQRMKPADRFEQLVSPYIDTLYRFAFRLCQCSDDAEELVQLLLTKLFPRLEMLEGIESLQPWLMRSLYNLYVDNYRKKQRALAVISPDEIPENARSDSMTPYELTELSNQQKIIIDAVQQLNDDQRLVLMLHDTEGYTLSEVSDITQTPLGTLKSRLHRSRNRVRELTEMELFGCEKRDNNEEEMK